mmetsp:Transcript_114242/g.363120  ORF Transcript_114242/g.363120 Transcript_114242/m.363120 type:complete len:214 (-) Transcript_114242:250-891(-)
MESPNVKGATGRPTTAPTKPPAAVPIAAPPAPSTTAPARAEAAVVWKALSSINLLVAVHSSWAVIAKLTRPTLACCLHVESAAGETAFSNSPTKFLAREDATVPDELSAPASSGVASGTAGGMGVSGDVGIASSETHSVPLLLLAVVGASSLASTSTTSKANGSGVSPTNLEFFAPVRCEPISKTMFWSFLGPAPCQRTTPPGLRRITLSSTC